MNDTGKNDTGKNDTGKNDTGKNDTGKDDAVVSAEPGTEAYTKTGDSRAVNTTHEGVGASSYFNPPSADEQNLKNPVSDTDPNFLEAARKLDPDRVPDGRGAADIEPKQE